MEEVEAPPFMEKKSRFRRVCVFCRSSPGKKAAYQAAAVQLGQQLVERGFGLVYGGGSVGLIGLVSHAVHNTGGHVIGELIGETPGEVKAVSGIHQRKAEMTRHSDAFVALPGGYGTLEELLEVITWAQLGIHDKPVGLLNVEGYYDPLLAFIDKAVDEGFIPPAARHIIVTACTPGELLAGHEAYVPAHHGASSVKLSWDWESSVDTTTCSSPMDRGIGHSTTRYSANYPQPSYAKPHATNFSAPYATVDIHNSASAT